MYISRLAASRLGISSYTISKKVAVVSRIMRNTRLDPNAKARGEAGTV